MTELPFSLDRDQDAFDFSWPAPAQCSAMLPRSGLLPRSDEAVDMPRRSPVRRRLLRWFAAQIAASAWLTTCVAYAMAPATLKPLPDDMTYALRFSRADEAPHPLPASLQDGFRLRLSFVDGAE